MRFSNHAIGFDGNAIVCYRSSNLLVINIVLSIFIIMAISFIVMILSYK